MESSIAGRASATRNVSYYSAQVESVLVSERLITLVYRPPGHNTLRSAASAGGPTRPQRRGWRRGALGGRVACVLALVSALVAFDPVAFSQSTADIPVAMRAAIVLRAAHYERTFRAHDGALRVAVVARGARDPDARRFGAAFRALALRANPDRDVNVDTRTTSDALGAYQLVHMCQGVGAGAIAPPADAVVSCDDPSLPSPCVLSVEPDGSRRRVVVHLARARERGLNFDARLLALARVVR